MVKKFKTQIMLNHKDIEHLERKNIDPLDYVKAEAVFRFVDEIKEFVEIQENDVVFDKDFVRYGATLILAKGEEDG